MNILNLVYPKKSDVKYIISKFPDGQQQVTIQSIDGQKSTLSNSVQIKARLLNFKDLELIICATQSLKNIGVKEIHLYAPYFLGARSDRDFEEGSNNYLKQVICPIINIQNFSSVTVLDPHSNCLEMGINNFKKLDNLKLVNWSFIDLYGAENAFNVGYSNNVVLVSPDAGATHKIYKLAQKIGFKGEILTCSKERRADGKLTLTKIPLTEIDYVGKTFVIIDDICDGGATFINIAKAIKRYDLPNKIYLIVTHGIFSKGFTELEENFDGVFTTNSYGQLNSGVEVGNGSIKDEWIGSSEDQYWPQLKKDFIKQLNIF